MNVVHRQIIRTGHPATDQQALQQMQAHAASQGLELQVQPLPEGGFQVDVVSRAPQMQPPMQAQGQQGPYGQQPPNPYAQPAAMGQAQGHSAAYGQNPYAQPPMANATQVPTPMAMAAAAAAPMHGQATADAQGPWQPQPLGGQGYGPPPQGAPAPATSMVPFGAAKMAAAPARRMAQAGACQACGRQAPTKQVTFHQNIGALIIRFPKRVSGQLCRTCISSYFWKYTTISFFFGWWGLISFFYTFVTIPMNIFTFLGALDLPKENPPGR